MWLLGCSGSSLPLRMSKVQTVYSLGARNEAEWQAEKESQRTQECHIKDLQFYSEKHGVSHQTFIFYSVSDSFLLP